jgi:hypothetical protein
MYSQNRKLNEAYQRGVSDYAADRAPLFRRTRDGYLPHGGSESDEETIAEWSQDERRAYLEGYES